MKRSNEYLLFGEFMADVLGQLADGVSVTRFVHESPPDYDPAKAFEFEVRIKRFGKDRLPAVTEAMAAKARKP